ncbi:zinc finger protein [Saccharopolyspora rosea]|uniref:Zinc finger protein n=1 Tax=Saccharopolyspora rosea TaxID=524884 RepID=A0ABW3FM69_9PSEU|nr:zinc finger protein [Saccharopolyspora rosea]
MPGFLTYIWRPVTGGRHAFPVAAREVPAGESVTAYCGAVVDAAELRDRTEADWIREQTCMSCWAALAARDRESTGRHHLRRRSP